MIKDEFEKPVDLKRHRQYEFISPKYLIRVFIVLTILGFMAYFILDFLAENERSKTKDLDQQQNEDIKIDLQSE